LRASETFLFSDRGSSCLSSEHPRNNTHPTAFRVLWQRFEIEVRAYHKRSASRSTPRIVQTTHHAENTFVRYLIISLLSFLGVSLFSYLSFRVFFRFVFFEGQPQIHSTRVTAQAFFYASPRVLAVQCYASPAIQLGGAIQCSNI